MHAPHTSYRTRSTWRQVSSPTRDGFDFLHRMAPLTILSRPKHLVLMGSTVLR